MGTKWLCHDLVRDFGSDSKFSIRILKLKKRRHIFERTYRSGFRFCIALVSAVSSYVYTSVDCVFEFVECGKDQIKILTNCCEGYNVHILLVKTFGGIGVYTTMRHFDYYLTYL